MKSRKAGRCHTLQLIIAQNSVRKIKIKLIQYKKYICQKNKNWNFKCVFSMWLRFHTYNVARLVKLEKIWSGRVTRLLLLKSLWKKKYVQLLNFLITYNIIGHCYIYIFTQKTIRRLVLLITNNLNLQSTYSLWSFVRRPITGGRLLMLLTSKYLNIKNKQWINNIYMYDKSYYIFWEPN